MNAGVILAVLLPLALFTGLVHLIRRYSAVMRLYKDERLAHAATKFWAYVQEWQARNGRLPTYAELYEGGNHCQHFDPYAGLFTSVKSGDQSLTPSVGMIVYHHNRDGRTGSVVFYTAESFQSSGRGVVLDVHPRAPVVK